MPFLHHREIPFERLYVDAKLVIIADDDGYVFFRMGDADVCHTVFKVWLSVVVMVEVHLLFKHFVEKCPYCQFLSSLAFASEKGYFFEFVCRN